MPINKRATKTLHAAGFPNLEVCKGMYGFSVRDKRFRSQSWEGVRETAAEAVNDVVIHGKLPVEEREAWAVDLEREWDDTIPIMEGSTVVACAWPIEAQVAHDDAASKANARLIAAAPELLSACEKLLRIIGFQKPSLETVPAMEFATTALIKARGR